MPTNAAVIDFLLTPMENISGVLVGGKVWAYEAGPTTTKKTIWLNRSKATEAANPYTLDSNGTAQLYGDGLYRIVIKDKNGVTVYDRDNLSFVETDAATLNSFTAPVTFSDKTVIYHGGTYVPNVTQDLPLAQHNIEVNNYDNPPVSNDRKFNVVSQMWSGVTPTASPTNNKSNVALAGSFTVHRGGNSGTFANALNPMISVETRPKGTVSTVGTAVTRVSGSSFLTGTGWQNANISINNAAYTIASVTDADHLTLTATAGTQTGVEFHLGGGIGVEVDINSTDDEDADDPIGMSGITIAAGGLGGGHLVRNGMVINGAWTGSGFQNGILLGQYNVAALRGVLPFSTTSAFLDGTNGATGSSFIRGGKGLVLKPDSTSEALRLTPGADSDLAPIIYGSDMANNVVKWSVTQNGTATLARVAQTVLPLAYSASVAIDAKNGAFFWFVANNGTAFDIPNPTNGVAGQTITVQIANTSGGALGAITWGSDFKMAAWTSPATGYNRSITFVNRNSLWFEVSRTASDIPN